MKYLKLFYEAFLESFSKEAGVQFGMLFVWVWRGMYLGLGIWVIILLILWSRK